MVAPSWYDCNAAYMARISLTALGRAPYYGVHFSSRYSFNKILAYVAYAAPSVYVCIFWETEV